MDSTQWGLAFRAEMVRLIKLGVAIPVDAGGRLDPAGGAVAGIGLQAHGLAAGSDDARVGGGAKGLADRGLYRDVYAAEIVPRAGLVVGVA